MTDPSSEPLISHRTLLHPCIDLIWERDCLLVVPRLPAVSGSMPRSQGRPGPFCLPYLFSSTIELIAGIGRCFWRKYRRSLTHLLYLDATTRTWEAHLPPQLAAPDDGRWDRSFNACTPPSPHLLLAGSVRSLPCQDSEGLVALLPPFDGVHVVTDPSRDWISFSCYLCVGGNLHPVTCDEILLDDCEPLPDPLLERVRCADRL